MPKGVHGNHARGEGQWMARLSEEDVRELRRSDEPYSAIAKRLGVSVGSVYQAKNGKTWRHVNGGEDS
jgi:DNA invertase Pin-like site-specific DNA recombinase